MERLNHLPLDFKNVIKLPESHTWTSNDPSLVPNCNPPLNPYTHETSVPIIDLNHPHAPTLIRDACEKWGVFQVINHGIPLTLLQDIEYQTRRLFALPMNRKLQALKSPGGFTGYGLSPISSFFHKLMWSEGFTIMGSSAVQDATKLWPHDHHKICNIIEEYQKEMKGLSEEMIRMVIRSLGLVDEDMKWLKPKSGSTLQAQSSLHLNSYPVCPDPSRAMGLAPHTDSPLLTLLYQGNISGLQVLKDNQGWVPVHPISGALVVIIGDLMHIISNGRFKNVEHRAVVNETHHRISVVHFYSPPKNVVISPSINLIDCNHPPLYRPVTWEELLDAKKTHFNKALDLIRCEVQQSNE